MIDIRLDLIGLHTHASCTIPRENGGEDTYAEMSSTGAKALTALVERLSKDYAGEEWQIVGRPAMHGTVPHRRYRRPTAPKARRAVQTKLFA